MDKQLGANISSPIERTQFLKDNCDKVEFHGYMKTFSEDELLGMKDELSKNTIEIFDIELEKKEVAEKFKQQLKPLNETKKILLNNIKHGSEFVNEECFVFVDTVEKIVGIYNSEGILVSQRRATDKDLQGTIFQIGRTGTTK